MISGDKASEAELTQLRRLEVASFVEGTTLLLLILIAVPLKYLGGWDMGVHVMGPMHGIGFVAYIWTALQTVAGADWSRSDTIRLLGVAFIPFGGFFNLPFLSRKAAALRAAAAIS